MLKDDTNLSLTVTGLGTSITRKITFSELARILLLIAQSSGIPNTLEESPSEQTLPTQVTIREFLNDKNASTNPQKIAAVAAYLKDRDYKSVTIEVFKQNFERAAEPVPRNITRDIRDAVRFGWIAESHKEQGAYFITATGETIVRSGFSSSSNSQSRHLKKNVGKKLFQPVNIRPEIQKIQIEQQAVGLKKYWDLNKGEKILWICARLKKEGVSELNYKEISYIASHSLGDNIENGDITALIESHKRANRVSTPIESDIRHVRILQPGIDYVSVNSEVLEKPNSSGSKTEETESK